MDEQTARILAHFRQRGIEPLVQQTGVEPPEYDIRVEQGGRVVEYSYGFATIGAALAPHSTESYPTPPRATEELS